MTPEERINEISAESGVSPEVVRIVLKAEALSAARSLAQGDKALLLGRCIMKPITFRNANGVTEVKHREDGSVKFSCTVSSSMIRNVKEQMGILKDKDTESKIRYIEIEQLDGLL